VRLLAAALARQLAAVSFTAGWSKTAASCLTESGSKQPHSKEATRSKGAPAVTKALAE
jgi:hypothetical protein